jgi:hypothetical protein
VATASTCAALGWSAGAGAWGAQGHQYVGSLGQTLLNPNAATHIGALLGPKIDLAHAAVWPDCIRSVTGSPSHGFTFKMGQFTPKACAVFDDNGPEEARMTDYAARNWTNCEYAGHRSQCNLAYHFADVNVRTHDRYDISYFGAGPGDVVQAINAAVTVLRCPDGRTCATSGPFNIKDKREALFLLAHFMGDVHQPLHVGAVYLDSTNAPGGDDGRPTTGGNALLLKPGQKGENLHHEWDTIAKGLGIVPNAAAVASGCPTALKRGTALGRPEDWASESVAAARAAYADLVYSPDSSLSNYWDLTFPNANSYAVNRTRSQATQLVAGGARLAAILNATWPSTKRPAACPQLPRSRSRR